jgi:MFS family permease
LVRSIPVEQPQHERAPRESGVFAALRTPNYRLYFGGQSVSLVGTWMQRTAQAWLVLSLTSSGAVLGAIVACQTLPVLLFGPYGGVVADRVDRRRLMIALQSVMGVQALALGVLTVTGVVRVWQIAVLALLLGLNSTFEAPARQSYILQMVGTAHLRNAVTLNSVMANAARAVGPAVAGVLIAGVGTGVCFLANSASFAAVVGSLLAMNTATISPGSPVARGRGQLREGLRYVRARPALLAPLAMMALVGTLAYEFQVSLAVAAKDVFHAGAQGYGFMTAAMGFGAITGGLLVAAKGRTGLRALAVAAGGFGLAIGFAAAAPLFAVELGALVLVGWLSVTFSATGNATLQLGSAESMRGRVMSLWQVAFQGSTPVGGPIIGWVAGAFGARIGLGVGAGACLVAAALAVGVIRKAASFGGAARRE